MERPILILFKMRELKNRTVKKTKNFQQNPKSELTNAEKTQQLTRWCLARYITAQILKNRKIILCVVRWSNNSQRHMIAVDGKDIPLGRLSTWEIVESNKET